MSTTAQRISRMAAPPTRHGTHGTSACRSMRRAWAARAVTVCEWKDRAGMCPHGEGPGSVDRGQEAAGGAIEGEASVLPGRALAETCQPLHVAPDRAGIRLVLFRQRVRLVGLLLRQIESPRDRLEHRIARGSELLGGGPQEDGAIGCGVRVDGRADVVKRRRPGVLNRRADVPAPEAGYMLEAPDDVIPAHHAKQEHIEGEGGGTDITVPENESAEQTGVSAVRGVVEIAVAVHEEQEHVSVSQVSARRHAFGAKLAVLVSERQGPRPMLGHEVEEPARQLLSLAARVAP